MQEQGEEQVEEPAAKWNHQHREEERKVVEEEMEVEEGRKGRNGGRTLINVIIIDRKT
jgi:hypothetical protein